MDKIHYMPGWVERSKAEKSALTREIHAKEHWIFEGGFSATIAERAARADMLIWLDLPVWIRLWRVLLRSYRYHGQVRPDMQDGCPERFNRQSSRKSTSGQADKSTGD
jgi:adenylate kinase family enzyme